MLAGTDHKLAVWHGLESSDVKSEERGDWHAGSTAHGPTCQWPRHMAVHVWGTASICMRNKAPTKHHLATTKIVATWLNGSHRTEYRIYTMCILHTIRIYLSLSTPATPCLFCLFRILELEMIGHTRPACSVLPWHTRSFFFWTTIASNARK